MFVLPKITASQGTCKKISPIHTLIQQILGSHELVTPISDHNHPEISETIFRFPQFEPPCKKTVHFIISFLRFSQF